eukprot:scaffold3338_cov65-Cylindrotheca_fusiformis.AAC.1
MFTSSNSIYACVGRREGLARLLCLEDEDMVEFAILMGNDYVENIALPKKKKGARPEQRKNAYSVASYLRGKDDEFEVKAQGKETELAFVRALYNLDDLESFPMQDFSEESDDTSTESEYDEVTDELTILLPDELRSQVPLVRQEDVSFNDAVQ